MSFWIYVDVCEKGEVKATTYSNSAGGNPSSPIRSRTGTTVSQVLRAMAAAMVTAKAETIKPKEQP